MDNTHHTIVASRNVRSTLRLHYLANCVDMSHRHDLTGAPVAAITAEERANAAARLDVIQAAYKLARQAAPGGGGAVTPRPLDPRVSPRLGVIGPTSLHHRAAACLLYIHP